MSAFINSLEMDTFYQQNKEKLNGFLTYSMSTKSRDCYLKELRLGDRLKVDHSDTHDEFLINCSIDSVNQPKVWPYHKKKAYLLFRPRSYRVGSWFPWYNFLLTFLRDNSEKRSGNTDRFTAINNLTKKLSHGRELTYLYKNKMWNTRANRYKLE